MIRLRLTAVALALMLGSNAWAELKTYDIDPQFQQEIFSALERILNASGPGIVQGGSYGRVQLLSSGQLVVNAPPETLEQVDQVLQAIRNRPAPPAPRTELYYWAVLGSRGTAANPPGTAPPSALNEVLAELKRMHGDLQFRVLATASLTTQSGQKGEVSGTAMFIEQTAFVQGETLNAEIDMRLQPQPAGVTVTTALRRGEFVVLGQNELAGGGLDGPVFFIVHWPEARAR